MFLTCLQHVSNIFPTCSKHVPSMSLTYPYHLHLYFCLYGYHWYPKYILYTLYPLMLLDTFCHICKMLLFFAMLSPSPSSSSAELAVFSFSPTHPRESKELTAIGNRITLLDYRTQIERRPTLFHKWKATSILWKMEDDLNFLTKWKTTTTILT